MKMNEVKARANVRKYRMAAEYASGDTMQQIADRWGLTRQRVQAMLASVGVQARPRGAEMIRENGE